MSHMIRILSSSNKRYYIDNKRSIQIIKRNRPLILIFSTRNVTVNLTNNLELRLLKLKELVMGFLILIKGTFKRSMLQSLLLHQLQNYLKTGSPTKRTHIVWETITLGHQGIHKYKQSSLLCTTTTIVSDKCPLLQTIFDKLRHQGQCQVDLHLWIRSIQMTSTEPI